MKKCAELFIQALKEKELKFDVKEAPDGDVIVRIGFDNKITNFVFSGETGEYVSMYTPFESVPAAKIPNVLFECNKLNSTYKWLKFYIDNDNDLMVEDDAILSEENAANECFELLVRRVSILKDVKPAIMRAIYMDL